MMMADWRAHPVQTAYKNNTSLTLEKRERGFAGKGMARLQTHLRQAWHMIISGDREGSAADETQWS